MDVRSFGEDLDVVEAWTLSDADPLAANTQAEPERVVPRATSDARIKEGTLRAQLPPVSWSALRLGRTAR